MDLLYGLHPIGVLANDSGRVVGAAFGGKPGVVSVTSGMVIDATPGADLALGAGAGWDEPPTDGPTRVSLVLRLREGWSGSLVPPREVGVAADVQQHGSLVEFTAEVGGNQTNPSLCDDVAGLLPDAAAVHGVKQALLAYQRACPPERRPEIMRTAEVVRIEAGGRLATLGGAVDRLSGLSAANLSPAGVEGLLALSQRSGVTGGAAWCMNGAVAPNELAPAMDRLAEEIVRSGLTDGAGSVGAGALRLAIAPAPEGVETVGAEGLLARDPAFEEPGEDEIEVELPPIPVAGRFDVVVAGAGTSGFPAAMAAAGGVAASPEGGEVSELTPGSRRVALCDQHGDLGGTHTVGGVPNFWFGTRSELFRRETKRWRDTKRCAAASTELAMLDLTLGSGVTPLMGAPQCGVVMEGGEVGAVVLAAGGRPVAVRGDRFIDATGDADLAAWSGCGCRYGAGRDEITLWASFGKFSPHRSAASRLYHDVVDPRSSADLTRAAIAGRRQVGIFGEADEPQPYVAPRETRHLVGRARLTYLDVLLQRVPAGTVALCTSNIDIKGMASSDLALCGFVEPDFMRNYRVGIPYAAMLPAGEAVPGNLLVTGKAYSASHDGMGMARMQADMLGLGVAAGRAAAASLEGGIALAGVDVEALRAELIGLGALPADAGMAGVVVSGEVDPRGAADRLAGEGWTQTDAATLVAAGIERAGPAIEAALSGASGEARLRLIRVACFLGETENAGELAQSVEQAFDLPELPKIERGYHISPDHGWAPQPAFDLNVLGRAQWPGAAGLCERLVGRIAFDTSTSDDQFSYAHSVSYVGERLAGAEMAGPVRALLEMDALRGRVLRRDQDVRLAADHVALRYAYLELCLARALARCGEAEGWRRLIAYLGDRRLFLARSALLELRAISGEGFGFDAGAWSGWVSAREAAGGLGVVPFVGEID